jgi:hypothetical protein
MYSRSDVQGGTVDSGSFGGNYGDDDALPAEDFPFETQTASGNDDPSLMHTKHKRLKDQGQGQVADPINVGKGFLLSSGWGCPSCSRTDPDKKEIEKHQGKPNHCYDAKVKHS